MSNKPCCRALTAECLSCSLGITIDAYCKKFPDAVGCDKILNKNSLKEKKRNILTKDNNEFKKFKEISMIILIIIVCIFFYYWNYIRKK